MAEKPSPSLLSESIRIWGADLGTSMAVVMGVSMLCIVLSFKELGGDGGVLAGGCWTLATIVAVPLGFRSYCWTV